MIRRPSVPTGPPAVPRFFLHIDTGKKVIPDEEGSEQPDFAAVRREAIATIIDMWGNLMRSGLDPRGYSFRIHDSDGLLRGSVPFMEAFDGLKN
jgi:hypothetical protein